MVNISEAYKVAMRSVAQEHRLIGTVGNVSFDESNIVDGSFTITNQSTDTSDVVLGSCYVGELQAEFTGLNITWSNWIGKVISPVFGLKLGNNEWESVPLGKFRIAKATHTEFGVHVTAYDNMTKFDKVFKKSRFMNLSGMYNIIDRICTDCGVTLGMTIAEIEALPNGSREGINIYGSTGAKKEFANDISTYRDLLFWCAQTLGCFATIDRAGQLVFRKYNQTVVDKVSDSNRLTGATFEDYITHYIGIYVENLDTNTEDYYGYDTTALTAELNETSAEISADNDRIDELVDDLEEWDYKLEHGQCTQAEYDAAVAEITAELHPLEIEVKQLTKRLAWLESALQAAGDDGSDMVLGANPLVMAKNLTTRDAQRREILGALNDISYTPFSASVVCGAQYDLGDVIQFSGGLYNSNTDSFGCVMSWTYTHNGGTELQGFGVDPAIVMVRNKTQKSTDRAERNTFEAAHNRVGEGSPYDPEDPYPAKEGDMYVQEMHPTVVKPVTKTIGCWKTYHACQTNLIWYALDTLTITCSAGNFVFCAARTSNDNRTWVVANSMSRHIENVYILCKVPHGDPAPTFTAEISNIEKHNAPPPYPFNHSDPDPCEMSYNIGYKITSTDNNWDYYYATVSQFGTWVSGIRYETMPEDYIVYTFDEYDPLESGSQNVSAMRDAIANNELSIPTIYDGEETNQLKYNDGSGAGAASWKDLEYVRSVDYSASAGGSDNGLDLYAHKLSLKKNVMRAWYKADPPQTDKKDFSSFCVRYTGSPAEQVGIAPYASFEWRNAGITKDNDSVYKIKCKGTYDGNTVNYVVYSIYGLTVGKTYYFNFKCDFSNNAAFSYNPNIGLGLVFNTTGTLSTVNYSGDEDRFYPDTNYYAFMRRTKAWYADFGVVAESATMYMFVLMQAETASTEVIFTMSEFVISEKARQLIRNIYLYDYTAKEWLKYKPFSGTTSGGDDGGSVVSIQPTIEEGTKIANYTIDGINGELYAPEYELPIASDEELGGIKVGDNLEIDENGVLSATASSEVELVELTQAQYDVLTPEEKADPNIIYFITDAGGGGGGGGSSTLVGLSDVSISNPTNGQVLKYIATTRKWVNANETGGGPNDDYSTAEQLIGTWIDGKPLYQKTVTVPNSSAWSNNSTFDNSVSNADMIWIYDGFIYDNRSTQKFVYPNPMVQNSDRLSFNIDLNDKSKFKVSCNTTYAANADRYAVLTVRYTKTTDN